MLSVLAVPAVLSVLSVLESSRSSQPGIRTTVTASRDAPLGQRRRSLPHTLFHPHLSLVSLDERCPISPITTMSSAACSPHKQSSSQEPQPLLVKELRS